MEKYLTVTETAQLLGTTPKGIRQRISRKQLPFRKFGRRVLIPSNELRAFMEALPGQSAQEAVTAAEVAGGWQ